MSQCDLDLPTDEKPLPVTSPPSAHVQLSVDALAVNDATVKCKLQQLAQAACDQPFAVLGPFLTQEKYVLRVWMPGADRVQLQLDDGQLLLMQRQAGSAFVLSADLDLCEHHYQLRIDWQGVQQQVDDPYQYHQLYLPFEQLHQPAFLYKRMGAQAIELTRAGVQVTGIRFLVYAPQATAVSVIGDFNTWDGRRHPLQRLDYGIWGLFIPNLPTHSRYKYQLKGPDGQPLADKTDPWAHHIEPYPSFASLVYRHDQYQWQDHQWQQRAVTAKHEEAIAIYEVHAGSWRRHYDGRYYTYRELADSLIPYVVEMGYTHIELMPIAEHPFDGSWGYQNVGIFAPTSRYGDPDAFKYFVDQCHQAGLAVILDWVAAHFPQDEHGLAFFDGTALYHDPDPRRGWHPDWHSYIYNLERDQVKRYLIANALYWLDNFHIDGLRVDAVASMLYLDYSRPEGQWLANDRGGNENDQAVHFFRWLNQAIYQHFPNALMIAEESTAYPGVTLPTDAGGLGFAMKWNMGWMHDSLNYIRQDAAYRPYHHASLTFPLIYAWSEHYILSLSHDEVVHGKQSLLNKIPGDEWQQTATYRAYLGYMYGQPGKKLHFMGLEFAQSAEWDHSSQLQWYLLNYARHQGVQQLVKDLNWLYRCTPALYTADHLARNFQWRLQDANEACILAHERLADDGQRVLVVSNFTAQVYPHFRIGVPVRGRYQLILNTDAACYHGSAMAIADQLFTQEQPLHGQQQSLVLQIPPMATIFYTYQPDEQDSR